MIACGNCKGQHSTVAEVKACCLGTVDTATNWNPAPAPAGPPATEKQLAFVRRLLTERDHGWADEAKVVDGLATSKAAASAAIESLLAMPKVTAAGVVHTLEDGIYQDEGGTIWKVYHTVHGANQQTAKRLVITEVAEGKYEGEFVYEGKAGLVGLTPAMRLSEEDAKRIGSVYGFCVRCAKTLTLEESQYVGYGKTCAGHEGWWYPSRAELKALQAQAKVDA